MAHDRCVMTPGPRFEIPFSKNDGLAVFDPIGNIFGRRFEAVVPFYELPPELRTAYPELTYIKPTEDDPVGKDPHPFQAIKLHSETGVAIFYDDETTTALSKLRGLFDWAEFRNLSHDAMFFGSPFLAVVRPIRYTHHCTGQPRTGVFLRLMAVKLNVHSAGLDGYEVFLADEEKLTDDFALHGGMDY